MGIAGKLWAPDTEVMSARVLAMTSALWVAVYAGVYFFVIKAQHGDVAVGYLVLLLVDVLVCLVAGFGWCTRGLLTGALVATAAAMVLGLLSVGLLLIPALIALTFGALRVSNVAAPPLSYESRTSR